MFYFSWLLQKKVYFDRYSQIEFEVLQQLRDAGHLMVVCSGNYFCDLDRTYYTKKKNTTGCKV